MKDRRLSLSDLALDRPVSTLMVLVAVFVLGLIATFQLPLSFLPAEAGRRIRVAVDINRTSPEVLEREVIRPLEENVAGLRNLKRMRVSSGSWGVRMNLEFETGTDVDARKLELRERIDRVRGDLPELVQRISISSDHGTADEPILRVQIASDKDLSQAYYLLQQRVVRPLERIDGVGRVELSGVEPHELDVALDVEAAKRNGVPVGSIATVVRSAQRARSLGVMRGGVRSTGVRSPAEDGTPSAYGALPLGRSPGASADGTSVTAVAPVVDPADPTAAVTEPVVAVAVSEPGSTARVGDVARVSVHPRERRRGSRLNGRRAVELEVYGSAGASTVDVSRAVREAVNQMTTDPALGGIDVIVFEDQGEMILTTLGDLRNTGIYGGLIGAFVLLLFLRRWRVTLIAALCIPMSVLAACSVLFLRGEELNCIVLLGLVLGIGMLIDNAVVIVESIQLQLQRGAPLRVAAREGARQVGLATVASTMSSVIVFLPMIVTDDGSDMSTYLRPLGATFVTALVASLLVSQTAVPLAMRHFAKEGYRRKETDVDLPTTPKRDGPLQRAYGWFIARTLRFPRLTLVLGLALCATAVIPATKLNVDMEPQERAISLPISLQLSGSRGHERVEHHIKVLEEEVLPRREELGIKSLACNYRDYGGRCEVYPSTSIESETEMSDFKQRLEKALPPQSGVRYHLGVRDRWRMRNRDPREVQFVIRGEDMGTLMKLSEDLAEHLRKKLRRGNADDPQPGEYDEIHGPFNEGSTELHVQLNGDRLQRIGVGASDVAQAISLSFQGLPLGQIQGPQGQVSLLLSTGSVDDPEEGPGLQELRDLKITLADGTEVPLSSLATIERVRSPWWLQRVDRHTEVRMKVRFFSRDQKANKRLLDEALEDFSMPTGYSVGQGTRWWERGDGTSQLLVNLALCLILVYAVMASLFESFLQPLGILITCLLGCVGAPWALYVTQTTVDTVAIIGLLILIGIVVNNGIMLVDRVTQLRKSGLPRDHALARAGQDRLRPIVMTAATTILGLLPMLLHHPTLAGVYYHGIAIIVAGGLLSSTLMTLVFLPAAYTLIEDTTIAARNKWRWVVR